MKTTCIAIAIVLFACLVSTGIFAENAVAPANGAGIEATQIQEDQTAEDESPATSVESQTADRDGTTQAPEPDMEPALAEGPVHILDPIVVSASRLRLPLSEVTSSMTVITAEEIEASKARVLKDVLPEVAALDAVQNGGPGQQNSVMLRGAASERTLVLVNGIAVNDPISPKRTTDISNLSLDNVERIEIVRGQQSVVFGSSAMGGVINLITKRGAGDWRGSLSVEAGSQDTMLGTTEITGAASGLGVALGASWENTRGFSAAKRKETYAQPQPAMDDDGYRRVSLDLTLDYDATPGMNVKWANRYHVGENEMDAGQGDTGDDPNAWGRKNQSLSLLEMQWETLPAAWEQEVRLGFSQLDRITRNETDAIQPYSYSRDEYRSRNLVAGWCNRVALPRQQLSVGTEYQQEQGMGHGLASYGETDFHVRSAHVVGVYAEDAYTWEGVRMLLGARMDTHDQYGSHFCYRLSPSYTLEATFTRLRASWGTAFNAPTLYQLYSKYGNTGLTPETSQGWEVGLDQSLPAENLQLALTYFQTDFKNQIDFYMISMDPMTWEIVGEYRNLSQVQTEGWEASTTWRPWSNLDLKAAYTKLTANDITDTESLGPKPLIRRADYKVSLTAVFRWGALSAFGTLAHVGPRWDDDWQSGERVSLVPYTVA
ncbi:TonB-dependent receptor, partial [candidate division FCPU426 bacterium]|nr:TonB-dependent receptor [candidate division FCPU426 bacterium]